LNNQIIDLDSNLKSGYNNIDIELYDIDKNLDREKIIEDEYSKL